MRGFKRARARSVQHTRSTEQIARTYRCCGRRSELGVERSGRPAQACRQKLHGWEMLGIRLRFSGRRRSSLQHAAEPRVTNVVDARVDRDARHRNGSSFSYESCDKRYVSADHFLDRPGL